MTARPDFGETSSQGHNRLQGKVALITGGDSGIGRAVALACAREGAGLGRLDILVTNAAYQMTREGILEIPDGEWEHTFQTNIFAMYYLCRAAWPHLAPGSTIINTASIQAHQPSPGLLPYAITKAASVNFSKTVAQEGARQGIRVNAVAPGPIWTPLIPATMPEEQAQQFGKDSPLGRPAQPAELAPLYDFLASDDSSYITGEVVGVTGGQPLA